MAATREGPGKRHFLEENDIFSTQPGSEAVREAGRADIV